MFSPMIITRNGDVIPRITDMDDILDYVYPVMLPLGSTPPEVVKGYESGLDGVEFIFYIPSDVGYIPVTKAICDHYGITAKELVIRAHASVHDMVMQDVCKMFGNAVPEELTMWAFSNTKRHHGSGLILSYDARLYISNTMKSDDIYIFPSSVHELILLRSEAVEHMGASAAELQDIVHQVNHDAVGAKEFLSNHVYRMHSVGQNILELKTVI